MDQDTTKLLKDYYRRYNEDLEKLFNKIGYSSPSRLQEELQKVIQEHGCNSRPDSKMELVHSESRSRPDSRQQQDFRHQQQIQENFGDQRQQEFTQMNGHGGEDT